jgi:hypothetical protein
MSGAVFAPCRSRSALLLIGFRSSCCLYRMFISTTSGACVPGRHTVLAKFGPNTHRSVQQSDQCTMTVVIASAALLPSRPAVCAIDMACGQLLWCAWIAATACVYPFTRGCSSSLLLKLTSTRVIPRCLHCMLTYTYVGVVGGGVSRACVRAPVRTCTGPACVCVCKWGKTCSLCGCMHAFLRLSCTLSCYVLLQRTQRCLHVRVQGIVRHLLKCHIYGATRSLGATHAALGLVWGCWSGRRRPVWEDACCDSWLR